jgi:hypothetical protein
MCGTCKVKLVSGQVDMKHNGGIRQPREMHQPWYDFIYAALNADGNPEPDAKLRDYENVPLKGDIREYFEREVRPHVPDAWIDTEKRDPKDGQVTQRLTAFVDDQGVLARLLDKYLGPQNSVLTETLARQVGETSALFKKLSPTDSEGLTKVLEGQLRKVMNDGHSELVRALDPLAEDGAVARFLRSLREELKAADEDRAKGLATALMALDANDETSLINRLVRETNGARQAVLHAVNPDAPNSPMARETAPGRSAAARVPWGSPSAPWCPR